MVATFLEYDSEVRLCVVNFTSNEILNIIRSLGINNARGQDDASIRVIKLSAESIITPQSMIFQNLIDAGGFSET